MLWENVHVLGLTPAFGVKDYENQHNIKLKKKTKNKQQQQQQQQQRQQNGENACAYKLFQQ